MLRRTHASLGHHAGIDPKVAADQRGQGSAWRLMFILRPPCPWRRSVNGLLLDSSFLLPKIATVSANSFSSCLGLGIPRVNHHQSDNRKIAHVARHNGRVVL